MIRMTLYRGAADRISFNYQWITSFGHLFDSKCQNIEKKKKKEKKKRKKERNGRPGRSSDANKSCTHNSLCVLIFVGLTVLLGRGVQKEEKARWQWRVRSSRLVVWSVQGRPSGSIKASVGYAAARPQKVPSVWETSFCNWID